MNLLRDKQNNIEKEINLIKSKLIKKFFFAKYLMYIL